MSGAFIRRDGELVALAETAYETEAVLQELLGRHPSLLIDDAGGGWLLIRREAPLRLGEGGPSSGFLDHLFVDCDGVLTLVEVKRSSDPRARREVVAQMLDYAANAASTWTAETLQSWFEERCAKEQLDPEQALTSQFSGVDEPEAFWHAVGVNLAAERFRLVFVADSIGPELRRIIEYLNGQMQQTEVLAIEVRQYRDADGEHELFIPRIIGQTEAAKQAKSSASSTPWTRERVLEVLSERRGPEARDVAVRLFSWFDGRGDLTPSFGRGKRDGSFQAGYYGEAYAWPFALYTNGRVEILFQWLARPERAFADPDKRRELQRRLNAIPGVDIPDAALDQRPPIDISLLRDARALTTFTDTMDWVYAEAQAAAGA